MCEGLKAINKALTLRDFLPTSDGMRVWGFAWAGLAQPWTAATN
jgi:hypothetical protein